MSRSETPNASSTPFSVISTPRRDAGTPAPFSSASTTPARSAAPICCGEALTNTRQSASGWRARNAQAWWMTSRPSDTIKWLSSATSRNAAGSSRPRSGWRQRTSASNAMTSRVPRIDDRLVVQLEPVGVERSPQIGLDRQVRERLRAHGRAEHLGCARPRCLAAKSAVSASRSSSSAVPLGAADRDARTERRPSARGRRLGWARPTLALTRPRSCRPARSTRTGSSTTTNSSPPTRATVSPGRRAAVIRRPPPAAARRRQLARASR